MSWRGKRKSYNNTGEGGEVPTKKPALGDSSEESTGDIIVCEISKNRRVSVRSWQGKPVVDIREFYEKDGRTFPGKKGDKKSISLNMDQWNILLKHVKEIDEAVAENT